MKPHDPRKPFVHKWRGLRINWWIRKTYGRVVF